jgi:hypothetical protein
MTGEFREGTFRVGADGKQVRITMTYYPKPRWWATDVERADGVPRLAYATRRKLTEMEWGKLEEWLLASLVRAPAA